MTDVTTPKVSEAERLGRTLTTLELIEPYKSPMGSRWAPGERAGFPEAEARDMVRRGIARAPANKMVTGDKTAQK